MRTSIDIPEPLMKRARKEAQRRGVTLRELVLSGLRTTLAASKRRRGYSLKDCSFGGDGLVSGLSWSDSSRIRELTYEGRDG